MRRVFFVFAIMVFYFLIIPDVSAWTANTFNNSLTAENLTIPVNVNITRYLAVPSTVSYLTAGMFNLSFQSSIINFIEKANVNITQTSGTTVSTYGQQFFAYYNFTLINVTRATGGTMKNCQVKNNSGTLLGNGTFIGENCFVNATITENKFYRIYFNNTDGTTYVFKYNDTMTGSYNVSTTNKFLNWTNGINSANTLDGAVFNGIINLTVIRSFNQTVNLSVGGSNVESFSAANGTSFDTIVNTGRLTSNINNYLSSCVLISGNCFVPFTFLSSTDAQLGYLNLLFSNEGFMENSQSYNSQSYTSSVENFTLNLTYDPILYSSISANIIYNGTSYAGTKTGIGRNIIYSASVLIPSYTSQQTQDFYWQVNMYNGTSTTYFNSTNKTQTILLPTSINVTNTGCSNELSPAFYFTFADEKTLLNLVNTTIAYNLKYGYSANTSLLQTFGNITATNNFTICINSSLPTYFVGYGEIQYTFDGFPSRKFYIFENTRLTNQTINNTLYALNTSSATEFSFNIRDSFANPRKNFYTALLRWYPSLNAYKIVEMGKTDDNGQVVNNLETGIPEYRVGVYTNDGTLIYLFSPVRFVCQALPCTYTFYLPQTELNLFNINSLQSSLTFNRTTKTFTYIWNDPTQATQQMNLTIYSDNYNSIFPICSTSSSGFTGLLLCDVSAYSGTVRAVVKRTASPPVEIASFVVNLAQQLTEIAGGKTLALFISLVLFVTGFLVGIFNPIVALILGAAALVPALMVGAFSVTWFVGLIILEVIIIHFMRRS